MEETMDPEDLKLEKAKFLPDLPIEGEEGDAFKVHSAYSKMLFGIVERCPTPFCVGLFGGWGTGKTTVIKLFGKRVIESQKHKYLYLDVWQFTHEPLKRWILFEIERQLKEQQSKPFISYVYDKKSLQENLEFSESHEEQHRSDSKNGKPVKRWIFSGTLILLGLVLYIFAQNNLLDKISGPISGLLVTLGLFCFLFEIILKEVVGIVTKMVFTKRVRTVTSHPAFSAEKFLLIFKDMVKQARNDDPKTKIIFVFDNLDRTSDEAAIETISAIKTFLNEEGCVYIIPCDERALIEHVTRKQCSDKINGDEKITHENDIIQFSREFLRKFFHATIRLPQFVEEDRFSFIDGELDKAGVPTDVRDLVQVAYSGKTPRQIKRFINDFIAHWMLARELEKASIVNSGELTNNLQLLAKFVVLHIEWPEFIDKLIKDSELLFEINEVAKKCTEEELIKKYTKDNVREDVLKYLFATKFIELPSDISPYLFFKRMEFAREATFAIETKQALVEGRMDFFSKLLTDKSEKLDTAIGIAISTVRDWRRGNRQLQLKNACSVFMSIFDKYEGTQKGRLIDETRALIETQIYQVTDKPLEKIFDYKKVFTLCGILRSNEREGIIQIYVDLFSSETPQGTTREERIETLKYVVENGELLNSMQKKEVGRILFESYKRGPQEEKDKALILAKLAGEKRALDLIDINLPLSIIEGVDPSLTGQHRAHLEIYLSIKKAAGLNAQKYLTTLINSAVTTNFDWYWAFEKIDATDLNQEILRQNLWPNLITKIRSGIVRLVPLALKVKKLALPEKQDEIIQALVERMPDVGWVQFSSESERDYLYSLKTFRVGIREKFKTAQKETKKSFLDKFKMKPKIDTLLDIIEPTVGWDVDLGMDILEGGYKELKKETSYWADLIKKLLDVWVKDRLNERKDILERLVEIVITDEHLRTDNTLIDVLADYCWRLAKEDSNTGCPLFLKIDEHLKKTNKGKYVEWCADFVLNMDKPMEQLQAYLEILQRMEIYFTKSTYSKIIRLAERRLGAAAPTSDKKIVLEFLHGLEQVQDANSLRNELIESGKTDELKKLVEAIAEKYKIKGIKLEG
jgi:hypothetical protein